jgi:transcriptional regulator with XRE-family HTH domain
MNIQQKLKQLRTERGLSQEQTAAALNISRPTYGHYERGRSEPDTDTLKRIAKFFNVSLDELCGLSEEDRHVDFAELTRTFNQHGITEEKYNALPDSVKETILKIIEEFIENRNKK